MRLREDHAQNKSAMAIRLKAIALWAPRRPSRRSGLFRIRFMTLSLQPIDALLRNESRRP
jgi:hypothetical protein